MGLTPTKYKETEVGLIPEEWGTIQIGALGEVLTGSTPPTNDKSNYGDDYLFVSPADLGKSKWILDTEKKLSKKGFDNSRKFPIGSILFTCIGSTIGKSGIASKPLTSNQQINAVLPTDKYCGEFIYYSLQLISQKIKAQAGEQAVPMVNKAEFEKFQIPLPPTLTEQKAIVQVISDTDALMQVLEQKIAKKKHIKKGVMQKLLTSKEDWEVKTLGDFLDYEQPTNYIVENTEYNDNYDIPVLTAGKSFILGYTNEKDGVFKNYPVIIFDDFTTATKYVDFPFKVKSSAMKILKPKNKDVILRFIFEIMQQIDFPLGDHKRHWIGEFQPLEIMVPKSKSEQIYIAQILADMGQEIVQLEEKLSKYQLAKQGMMQQLLTGKIRLV